MVVYLSLLLSILSHPLLPLQMLLKIVSVNLMSLQNRCSPICFCCLVADLVTPIAYSTSQGQVSLSYTLSQNWLKLMSIESVILSNHLILCRPLLLLPSIFPSIRVFSSESAVCIRWPECWSFSFSISPFTVYSRLTSFSIDWFDLLAVQGTHFHFRDHKGSESLNNSLAMTQKSYRKNRFCYNSE